AGSLANVMTALLIALAAIALLTGGLGIAGLVYTSVMERRREIGIRRAVGARQRDVRTQFAVEGIFLACIGGAAGLAIGVLFSLLLPVIAAGVPAPVVSAKAVLLPALLPVAVGFVAG